MTDIQRQLAAMPADLHQWLAKECFAAMDRGEEPSPKPPADWPPERQEAARSLMLLFVENGGATYTRHRRDGRGSETITVTFNMRDVERN